MEITNAELTYTNTLTARDSRKSLALDHATARFNSKVFKSSVLGNSAIYIEWPKLLGDTDESVYCDDSEIIAELLDRIIEANYEVAFMYSSPNGLDACGIVASWGPNAEKDMKTLIASLEEKEIAYSGEDSDE